MQHVHLICGLPCSGKTFFARQLALRTRALYLGLDQILTNLHGQYSIDSVGHAQHIERVIAARHALWIIAQASLAAAMPVVLDDGFFLRETRERYKRLCAEARTDYTLYYLDTPIDTILNRLTLRNKNLPLENFFITQSMQQRMQEIFEVPANDEQAIPIRESECATNCDK